MSNGKFIKDFLCSFSTADENVLAFSLYDGNEITNVSYSHFVKDILKSGGFFAEHSIRNQHIALLAPNSYEWLVTFFAILASGNVVVPLNPAMPAAALQQCEQADVSLVCGDEDTIRKLKTEKVKLPCVVFDETVSVNPMTLANVYCATVDETVMLLATSGTTGKSKIVEYSAYNLMSFMDDVSTVMKLPDRMLVVLPLFHVSGLASVLYRLFNLQHVCMNNGMQYLIRDIHVFNPSNISLVPAVLDSIVKLTKRAKTVKEREKYIGNNLSAITVSGTSVNPDLCLYLMELGIEVQTGYGMTETLGCTFGILNEKKLNTIGKPIGRTRIKIVDGELLIKGPFVMKGYYNDPEETAKIVTDGWLHTGDMGYCDENGDYYITGRKKNVIILANGENVNPEEIEAKFYECEAIQECMVYSDGKGICADVYTENEKEAAVYIRNYNIAVPMYYQVYKVNYCAEPLEKTGTNKIKRKENM